MYAAKINGKRVTQVIVGDAAWAQSRLGGMWVSSDKLVGIGWLLVDGEIVPPPVPEIDPDALI